MRDRVIKIPDLSVSNSKSVILRKNISDYTLPELNRLRMLCNFTKDEKQYFNLKSKDKSNISIAMSMNISESNLYNIIRKVKSKISRVSLLFSSPSISTKFALKIHFRICPSRCKDNL